LDTANKNINKFDEILKSFEPILEKVNKSLDVANS
jgi:hypothetical protein